MNKWMMSVVWIMFAVMAAVFYNASAQDEQPAASGGNVEQGKYLVQMCGCNDCHTPRYMDLSGNVPVENWLTGDTVGWKGPWGTTYAANLRKIVAVMTEDEWVNHTRNLQAKPPMPSYVLKQMRESDLRSIYAFIHSLGASGEPAPPYLAPGMDPQKPYFELVLPTAPQ